MSQTSRALFYTAPLRAELRAVALPALKAGEARVRMAFSALSRGSERLVASGAVPPEEFSRMRCPAQGGDFPFPVKYGYCAVGVVEDGPAEWLGARVFALHPHQERFVLPVSALQRIPESVPSARATLAANMETALNALWDSGASAADRIVVVGGGLLGLLIGSLCARLPGAEVTLVDVEPARAALATSLGARFALPDAAPRDADVVFHCSATPSGLATALTCAAPEARVVELSWYGAEAIPVALGAAFHAARLSLVSSQVGRLPPARVARGWTHAKRLAAALALLEDARLDALISETIPFSALPEAIPRVLAPGAAGIATLVSYQE